jgi:DNA-binding NarL/FixJ family response regulator
MPDAVICVEDSIAVLDVALSHALQDSCYISPSASRPVLAELHVRGDASAGARVQLSDREREVLHLMMEGLATKAIARRLHIAVKTVEAHRARIFTKLQVRNQKQAVVLALSEPHLLDSRR